MPDTITQLIGVLADERNAVLAGDFTRLTELSEQKNILITSLGQPQDIKVAQDLAQTIRHNQSLLQAAIDGISAARERFDAIQQVQQSLSIYDPSGLQTIKEANGVNLRKKA